jgi:hypothetical protein
VNLDLGSLKLEPENVYLMRILEKDKLSLNVGANQRIGVLTLGYKTKIPVIIHSGFSKKWESLFKAEFPGVFIGFEIQF